MSLKSLLTGFVFMVAVSTGLIVHAKTVLIPLPQYGFDPTESSIPWSKLQKAGHKLVFATPNGRPAAADVRMLTGQDLPKLLKKSLMAEPQAVQIYSQMANSQQFKHPISYDQVNAADYDALLLVGGHDKGMREYLESATLQKTVAYFFDSDKPVGAICHGTLLAARSVSSLTGKSVLYGRKTTGLTRNQEWVAYQLTRAWLGDYYRTYSVPMAEELISFLRSPADYDAGPGTPIPLGRDSDKNLKPGFTVRDGLYLSGRWPGDAHKFGNEFVQLIEESR